MNNKGADQTAQMWWLICTFIVCIWLNRFSHDVAHIIVIPVTPLYADLTFTSILLLLPCWIKTKWATARQNQQNDMCAQRRLRSAWASAQSDQSSLSTRRNHKSLSSFLLCSQWRLRCASWSESSLGAHVSLLVLSCCGSNICGFGQLYKKSVWIYAHLAKILHTSEIILTQKISIQTSLRLC